MSKELRQYSSPIFIKLAEAEAAAAASAVPRAPLISTPVTVSVPSSLSMASSGWKP